VRTATRRAGGEGRRRAGWEPFFPYPPPIFAAIKRITAGGPTSLIHDAIRRGVAIYSPHTALDVADGGTNDVLADVLGLDEDRSPLKIAEAKPSQYKLVVF